MRVVSERSNWSSGSSECPSERGRASAVWRGGISVGLVVLCVFEGEGMGKGGHSKDHSKVLACPSPAVDIGTVCGSVLAVRFLRAA